MISIGPTGNLVRGSVLDCSKAALERALKVYDSQLYITWNPKKRSKLGVWEIRRRPDKNTVVYKGSHEGMNFYSLESVELDVVNHVLDVPVLGYHVLKRIQEMDAWKINNWVDYIENVRREYEEREQAKTQEDMNYMIKQHKREVREFRELVLSGFNPARIASYWGRNS